jgi:hypothetical protein
VVSSGKYTKKELTVGGALKEAFKETWGWIVRICVFVVKLFTGALSIKMIGGIDQNTIELVFSNVFYAFDPSCWP